MFEFMLFILMPLSRDVKYILKTECGLETEFRWDEFQRFVQVTCKIKVRQGFVRQPAYIDLLASPDIAGSLTVWLDFHP